MKIDGGEDLKAMDSSSSDVGPTEDVVQALLDYLVDPVLPLKSSARKAPSLSQQQSVAKQVHAVVLLYNYYHRKNHTILEFLDFESFCKLAVILKPSLMGYMNLMHRSDYSELDDLENHISLTEKAVMNACDISSVLDASKDVPITEGWSISKVAVLLVDSKRENCFLLFSSITHGIWSIIENNLDASNISSEGTVKGKHTGKRKRNTKKLLRDELGADESSLQQLAFSVVKEAAGINQTDLMVLESHVVYSLSKEKTAARFYIVQCTQSFNEDLQVPVKDVIESLQGPLVEKIYCGWMVTPVVEYFHVLPYAGILTDWISREVCSNCLQDLRVEKKNIDVNSSQRIPNPCNEEITEVRDKSNDTYCIVDSISNQLSSGNSESPKQNDNNRCQMTCLSNSVDGPHSMDDSSVVCPQKEDKSTNIRNVVKVHPHQKKRMTSMESDTCASRSGVKAEMVNSLMKSCITEFRGDLAPVPFQSNSKYLEKLQVTLALKENALLQTALRVLLRKREIMSHQVRKLQDEIALCDKDIKTIVDGATGEREGLPVSFV